MCILRLYIIKTNIFYRNTIFHVIYMPIDLTSRPPLQFITFSSLSFLSVFMTPYKRKNAAVFPKARSLSYGKIQKAAKRREKECSHHSNRKMESIKIKLLILFYLAIWLLMSRILTHIISATHMPP